MKCVNCGHDNEENARFCQGCGAALETNRNSLSELMLQLLNDNMFMVLCILLSVSVGFSLITANFSVVNILMTIFLWLVFAQSKEGNSSPKHMRCVSGTIFASYIIQWVLCCIYALTGLFFTVLYFMSKDRLWEAFYSEFGSYFGKYFGVFNSVADVVLILFSIGLIIMAIVGACLNAFGRRTIHRFAQSLYKNLEYGQANVVKCGAAQAWMIVYGVINALSAALSLSGGNLSTFLEKGCMSTVFIMGSVLVNKYFGKGSENTAE